MYFDETAWVAVAFIIFIALVWKKASKAIVSILDNRSLLIHNELNEAKSLKEEALEELRKSLQTTFYSFFIEPFESTYALSEVFLKSSFII